MKKILALVLVVCLALGCFVGCKKDKDTKATKKPTTTTSAPATTAPAEDVTPSEDPAVDPTEEPSADPTEEPAPTDGEGDTTVDPTEEPAPAGDWEMPDNSGIDCYAFDFRNGDIAMSEWAEGYSYLLTGSGSINEAEFYGVDPDGANPGYLAMDILGTDSYFYFYSNADTGENIDFDLQDYPFMKIVMKNKTSDGGFELFVWDASPNGLDASDVITFGGISSNDKEFKTYCYDLRKSGASNGNLTVTPASDLDRFVGAFRFDGPAAADDSEPSVEIQYIGFFKTAADAQAYK
ncbi:MAG: hypothetical protein E7384_00200 [Ruminococcaceae bacterium]|nr:hypothetical protein [Oscillospiraceae bacterium]